MSIEPRSSDPFLPVTLVACAIFVIASTAMSVLSHGFLEADGITHYLYARFAFHEPAYFADVWSRPVRTMLHAIPAQLGVHGVRAMSLLIALACATLAILIAKRLNLPWPWAAGLFVFAQPMLFLHSFSELTELPFAMLLGAAMLAYASKRWTALALLVGTLPASRPEGFGVVLVCAIALMVHRSWLALILLPVPLIIWNYLGWELWGRGGPWWRWLIDQFPYSGESMYDAGHPLKFVALLPAVVGPVAVAPIFVGLLAIARRWRGVIASHEDRTLLATAAMVIGVIGVHSYLHASGKMASSGEPRYLITLAVPFAIVASAGFPAIVRSLRLGAPILAWTILVLAFALPFIAQTMWRTLPLGLHTDGRCAVSIAKWYRDSDAVDRYPRVISAHPMVLYSLDTPPTFTTSQLIDERPPGVLIVWDPIYSRHNADPERTIEAEALERAGWTRVNPPDLSACLEGSGFILFASEPEMPSE